MQLEDCTCKDRCGLNGCDHLCSVFDKGQGLCCPDKETECTETRSSCASKPPQYNASCNTNFTVEWDGPGPCGIIIRLVIDQDYDNMTISTCGSYRIHGEDTVVWHGRESEVIQGRFFTTTTTTGSGTTTTTTCDVNDEGWCSMILGSGMFSCETCNCHAQCQKSCGCTTTTTTTFVEPAPAGLLCYDNQQKNGFRTGVLDPIWCAGVQRDYHTGKNDQTCFSNDTSNSKYGQHNHKVLKGETYLIGIEFDKWSTTYQNKTTKSKDHAFAELAIECEAEDVEYIDEYPIGCEADENVQCEERSRPKKQDVGAVVIDATYGVAKAGGDPVLADIKGNRFDIVREGRADLLLIRKKNNVLLKVQGLIKRVLPCHGTFLCKLGLFITEVTLSGSWAKKKFHFGTEKTQNEKELSVLIDGTEAWPLSIENSIFSELNMRVSNFSTSDQGLRFDFMNTTLDIRRVVQNYVVCNNDNKVKFFNIYFRGARELLSQGMTIGGILGNDPHKNWEKCDISNDKSNLFQNLETERNFLFAKVE